MTDIINTLNGLLWNHLLIYLLLGIGLYFTFRTGFIQFRHFGHMFSVLKHSKKSDKS
ncbi:sodium:alanine symporter family protein, partial [Klebsiella pneumoniae]|nr:sodium:alanine symporter family protein [Klebsiella pneumoniae]